MKKIIKSAYPFGLFGKVIAYQPENKRDKENGFVTTVYGGYFCDYDDAKLISQHNSGKGDVSDGKVVYSILKKHKGKFYEWWDDNFSFPKKINLTSKKYFSTDIEATGITPGKYSMVSLGTCVVGDTDTQFYRELKPLNKNFSLPALKVAVKGLKSLEDLRGQEEFDPESKKFNPEKVIEVLFDKGEDPKEVMSDYADWVNDWKINRDKLIPVEVAAPIKWDGMFTAWYFDNFYYGKNPFGYSGVDINSMYRGATKNIDAHVIQLGLRGEDLPHNALEDAIIQAKELEEVLKLMKENQE